MESAFLTPAQPHATAEILAAAAARGQATASHAAAPPSSARAQSALMRRRDVRMPLSLNDRILLLWNRPCPRRQRRTRPPKLAQQLWLVISRPRRTLLLRHQARTLVQRRDVCPPTQLTSQLMKKQQRLIKAMTVNIIQEVPRTLKIRALKRERPLPPHQMKILKRSWTRKGSSGPWMGATMQPCFAALGHLRAQILGGRNALPQMALNALPERSSCASADAPAMQITRLRHSLVIKTTMTRAGPIELSLKWRPNLRSMKSI
jgi:hypothetical protein